MIHHHFLSLSLDAEKFEFETGCTFRGLTITEGVAGYRVILRANIGADKPVYALNECQDPVEGLEDLLEALCQRQGKNLWQKDQFVYSKF